MNSKKTQAIQQPQSPSREDDEYLRTSHVAKLMNCSQTSVYRLARTGAIPAFYFNGMVRIPRSGLHAWLKANTTNIPSLD